MFNMIPLASAVDPILSVGSSDGGSSWMMSILARDNQAEVRFHCDAGQTSSRSGPVGKERSVVSDGSEVMDLNKSLNA
jgi:hypothetical protein